MCFETTARPPRAPRTGFLAADERLTLRSDTEFAATLATTSREHAPGVVVLPDVRGLHPYYEALAREFGGAGVHALAIDLYGRTAGAEWRSGDFEWQLHRAAARDTGILADVAAAVAELRARGAVAVYVLGFCFGGRAAFMSGTLDGVDGVVGFYGWPTRESEEGSSPLAEARAGRLKAPVVALYGGADEGIPEADVRAFAEALSEAGVAHETVVYEGAPHSFFDRAMAEHEQACEDAWRLCLRFMGVPVGG